MNKLKLSLLFIVLSILCSCSAQNTDYKNDTYEFTEACYQQKTENFIKFVYHMTSYTFWEAYNKDPNSKLSQLMKPEKFSVFKNKFENTNINERAELILGAKMFYEKFRLPFKGGPGEENDWRKFDVPLD